MRIFDVLRNERPVFILDDIEDKKTKALITQINSQMSSILNKLDEFNEFADSQLEGEYNKKIVKAKSLQRVYSGWNAINNACINISKEETQKIEAFMAAKKQLVDNLKILLNDSLKLPVVSVYDVFNGDFVYTKKDHNVIILGNNNRAVIETIIDEIEKNLFAEGNFNEVEPVELKVNYSSVDKNVEECKKAAKDLFEGRGNKEEKVLAIVDAMEKSGKDLVFFSTFKEDLKMIGCSNKEIDLYEKDLLKKYVPLKKQLSKLLKVDFITVTDIVLPDEEYVEESSIDFNEDLGE